MTTTIQLRRIRWAVRGVLTLGVAASVTANILHANDNPISQTIAAWPPLALLLTVELISRVPVHRRGLAAVRLLSTATIAGIAAWVSYWHMAGVVSRYGETGAAPYLMPFSVDGLVVVASISLVELAGRIRTAESPAVPAAEVTVPGPFGDGTAAVPGEVGDQDDEDGQDVTADLLDQARALAAAHLAKRGRPITRDQLRAALRTGTNTATVLHRQVKQDARPGLLPVTPDAFARANGSMVDSGGDK
jgi:hypothetical protein